jgi:2,5-diketo-D-gluconate reductase B
MFKGQNSMSSQVIPSLGLGTYRLTGKECEKIITQALEIGYRHFDTADAYGNHWEVGRAIKHFPRKELFIVTKIDLNQLAPNAVRKAVPRFLKELAQEYIDLLLVHWPAQGVNLAHTLQAMMEFKEKGVVHHLGVSNFVRSHIEELAPHFPILTNQIELHPYLQRYDLVETCKKFGVHITAYRPLAKGAFEQDKILKEIGSQHGKTASQSALRWCIQKGYAAIPKAATPKHLKENFEIFDFTLNREEMQRIDALDANKRYCAPEGFPVLPD